ncbi:MAG TPA: hypothetical protein VKZ18_24875 [Polyangia bacterium]|nr:hypothetical protein [Polyangia bacterium]
MNGLAHRLYTNTLSGFGSLDPAEAALSSCLNSNSLVDAALSASGLVPIPMSVGGVQTLAYPAGRAANPPPLPNLQGGPGSLVDLPWCQ